MLTPKYEEFTIENLIRLFQKENDEKAFDQILKRYYHLIYGACLKLSDRQEDAKDLTLEVCTAIWENLKTQEVNNFNSWVYSICHNHCMDFHRAKKTNIELVGAFNSSELENIPAETETEEEHADDKNSSLKKLNNLIATLPSDQRICMKLFYLKKLSYNKISSRTGYSIKKIKSALQSGRNNLRKAINI